MAGIAPDRGRPPGRWRTAGSPSPRRRHDTKIGPLELSVKDKERVNIPIWAGRGRRRRGRGHAGDAAEGLALSRAASLLAKLAIGALVVAILARGRPVLLPIAFAAVLAFILTPPVKWLERRIPTAAGAGAGAAARRGRAGGRGLRPGEAVRRPGHAARQVHRVDAAEGGRPAGRRRRAAGARRGHGRADRRRPGEEGRPRRRPGAGGPGPGLPRHPPVGPGQAARRAGHHRPLRPRAVHLHARPAGRPAEPADPPGGHRQRDRHDPRPRRRGAADHPLPARPDDDQRHLRRGGGRGALLHRDPLRRALGRRRGAGAVRPLPRRDRLDAPAGGARLRDLPGLDPGPPHRGALRRNGPRHRLRHRARAHRLPDRASRRSRS